MEIKGKVHCFFEQSGTFKNEFIKLGIPSEDYDIQNNFGETDHVVDLFKNIEDAYEGKPSLFDDITQDDLIMAFFPCIHFCDLSTMNLHLETMINNNISKEKAYGLLLKRHKDRDIFFALLTKMFSLADIKNLRLIFENPYNGNTYLKSILRKPDVFDRNRMYRGDYMVKPTGYWFINCFPTYGLSMQKDKKQIHVWDKYHIKDDIRVFAKRSSKAGICSEERSMISPDYARNFICDFIIGKEQINSELDLFK